MLNLVRAAIPALAVVVLGAVPAAGQSARQEAEKYLQDCAGHPPSPYFGTCEEQQASFVRDYERAMRGDYQGQRNVAFVLGGGDRNAPITPNRVQGCAWRLVITLAGHPEAGAGDAGNLRAECSRLQEADRLVASARASEIMRQIGAAKARRR